MTKRTIEVEELSLGDLTPDPINARRHNPRNVGAIAENVQAVGAARSGVVDEGNVILAGNGAAEAFGEVGMDRVLVIDVDGTQPVFLRRSGLTDAQKRTLALGDNRTSELAEWDTMALQQQLRELQEAGEDLFKLGWNDEELRPIFEAVSTESDDKEQSGVGGAKLTFSSGQWEALLPALREAQRNMPGKASDAEACVWMAQQWQKELGLEDPE